MSDATIPPLSEAALAAKDARIADLEADANHVRESLVGYQPVPQQNLREMLESLTRAGMGKPGTANTLWAMVHEAESTIAELREALQPFADIGIPDNWPAECVLTWTEMNRVGVVQGRYAYISYLSSDVDAAGVPTIADYRRATAHLAKTAPEAD